MVKVSRKPKNYLKYDMQTSLIGQEALKHSEDALKLLRSNRLFIIYSYLQRRTEGNRK